MAQADAAGSCPLTSARITDVVMSFAELFGELHGIQLHSYQRVFMRRITLALLEDDGSVITGLWSRQSGKSEALSSLAPALCILLPALGGLFPSDLRLSKFRHGFWMGIFAPRQQQASIIYERIRARAERGVTVEQIYNDPDLRLSVVSSRGDQVSWSNNSFVTAQTASEQSNVEGKTFHLVIIDEAQLVSGAKINKEIKPMLASTNGVLVLIGTANALRGNFKKTIEYNIAEERVTGRRDHFEFPYDQVIASRRQTFERTKDHKHLAYESWVGNELKRLGGNIENEEFRQNFRLLWQDAQTGAFDLEALSAAGNRELSFVYSRFNGRIVAGLDYGRKRDCTILTIMEILPEPIVDMRSVERPDSDQPIFYKKRILAWYEIPGRKWHDILEIVTYHVSRYAVGVLVADSTGVGDPLTETLQNLLPGVTVYPYVCSVVGNDRMYKLYIQEMEAMRIEYPASPSAVEQPEYQHFIHEHQQLLKDRHGVFIKCVAPDGEHDDYPDSGALACFASTLEPEGIGMVEVEDNPFFVQPLRTRHNAWAGQPGGRAARYR